MRSVSAAIASFDIVMLEVVVDDVDDSRSDMASARQILPTERCSALRSCSASVESMEFVLLSSSLSFEPEFDEDSDEEGTSNSKKLFMMIQQYQANRIK